MSLRRFELHNFRCFREAIVRDCVGLTVLIGENDAGKSSVLDAIEILFGARQVERGDLSRLAGAGELRLIAELDLPKAHALDVRLTVDGAGERLELRRTVGSDLSSAIEVRGMMFEDPRFEDFGASATDDKAALEAIGIIPGKNGPARSEQFENAKKAGSIRTKPGWIPMDLRRLADVLPEVQRVSSDAFADPADHIRQLVSEAVRNRLEQFLEESPAASDGARDAAKEAAASEAASIAPHVEKMLPRFKKLELLPEIDFRRPRVTVGVQIDLGDGMQQLDGLGYGTRRRTWIALEHRRIESPESRPVIRLYDEPDSNLHYEAQRTLFRSIRDAAMAHPESRTIVCTHAVTLIDGAPATALRVVRSGGEEGHTIRGLADSVDKTMLDVLGEVGAELGLTNLAVLYERAFLLVEGETEMSAVPDLYRMLYGTRIQDDGIRVVNLDGCSSWPSVVRVLLAARSSLVHLMLDQDCSSPDSSARLNRTTLADLHLDMSNVTLVGAKEFEDAFSDDVWARVLEAEYARADASPWEPAHVASVRHLPKFSEEIQQLVYTHSTPQARSRVSKPKLGAALARHAKAGDVPPQVAKAFAACRKIAGL